MRIVMLLQGEWMRESRVVREAECLARAGYRVDVICLRMASKGAREKRNGVTYHSIPYEGLRTLPRLVKALRIHLNIVSLGAQSRNRRLRARGVLETSLGLISSILSIAFAVMALPGAVVGKIVVSLARAMTWGAGDRLGQRLKRPMTYLVQPFSHLNAFGVMCRDLMVQLEPTIVHAHDLVTLSAGALVAKQLGCPLIYDAHELERHTNYPWLNKWTKYWLARYEDILIGRAASVVTVSDSIADWLASEYVIQRPRVVLNSPAGPSPVLSGSGPPERLRSRLGLTPDTPLVVHVGWVTVERGLDRCVQALQHLPGAHFAAVGPRYDATEMEMTHVARALGVENRIHFVDPVPHEQVMSFIASADCSVIAIQNVSLNNYFCFPNKLLDSVMAGLPVVVANLKELRRFVERYDVGVVMDETDPLSIAAATREVLANAARYRPSRAKIADIEQHFGWLAQQEQLLKVYRGLVAPTAGRRD